MKVLILSCNTGGGHNAASDAIAEELKLRNHEVDQVDYLALKSEKNSKFYSDLYINTVLYVPLIFGFFYKLGALVSKLPTKTVIYHANKKMAKYLEDKINEKNYDFIITTHMFPMHSLTYLKEEGRLKVPFISVLTDYTCIPFYEESSPDYYIIPHKDIAEELKERRKNKKINSKSKILDYGIPVKRIFKENITKTNARKRLGLEEYNNIYLFMAGSMGSRKTPKYISKFSKYLKEDDLLIVICGNNEKQVKKLKKKFKKMNNLKVLGFTKDIFYYMKASDLLLTKPGGLSSTESAVSNTLTLHLKGIPGCETINREFFNKRGLSIKGDNIDQEVEEAISFVKNKEEKEEMLKSQDLHINKDASKNIVDLMEKVKNG